jgi:DNA-binding transcriptional regulator YhcF (GntR family)
VSALPERLVREAWDGDPAPSVDQMAAMFEVNPSEMRRRLDELGLSVPTG